MRGIGKKMKGIDFKMKRIPRSKAIRLKCLDCCNGSANEVKLCTSKNCPLYIYRMGYEIDSEGKRIKKNLTDEAREQLSERMKKVVNNE